MLTKELIAEITAKSEVLARLLGTDPSMAIAQATEIVNLIHAMRQGNARFRFLKKDGTVREALGTLRQEVIAPTIKHTGRETPAHLVAYYDLDKQSWRSFNIRDFLGWDEIAA